MFVSLGCFLCVGLGSAAALTVHDPLQLGIAAMSQQDYPTAIQQFSEAIQQQQNLAVAFGDRCLAYLLVGEEQRAVADCSAALAMHPVPSKLRFYRGLAHYRLGLYAAAIADFTQYLELQPQDPRALYNLGLTTFAQGDVERAILHYRQAVDQGLHLTSLEKSNLYNDLGVAYLAANDFAQAIDAFDRAVFFDDADPRAFFNRGCACHQQGNYEAALLDFERALALDPHDAETYINRSKVKQQIGDLTGAIADLRGAIALFQQQGHFAQAQQAKLRLQQLTSRPQAIG